MKTLIILIEKNSNYIYLVDEGKNMDKKPKEKKSAKDDVKLTHFEPATEEDDKKPARELVTLSHVETQKQKVDRESLAHLLNLQQEVSSEQPVLDSDDRIILGAFEKKRLMLERIWIIVNETRVNLGMEATKQSDIKARCNALVENGYLTHEEVEYDNQVNNVYILTEKGSDEIQ